MSNFNDQQLRDWWLRRLDAETSAALEQALFTEIALADRIDEARYDLYDDYAHGRLSPDERACVDRHLTRDPNEAQRLRVAGALAEMTRTTSQSAPPATTPTRRRHARGWLTALAASVALVAILLSWRVSPPQSASTDASADPQSLPTVTLSASSLRGASVAKPLPSHRDGVRLQLEIDAETAPSTHYGIRIAQADHELFQRSGLSVRSVGRYRYVEATLPANVWLPGALQIRLDSDDRGVPPQRWNVQVDDGN